MFNQHDLSRNQYMLTGSFKRTGYDWWWHSFTATHEVTKEEKSFFIEFFLCNPAKTQSEPVFGQLAQNKQNKVQPSYMMIKAGCWGHGAKQIHRFFAWNEIDLHGKAPFSIAADDCYISDIKLKGKVALTTEEAVAHPEYMSDAGSMEWHLELDKQVAFNVGYGASPFFRWIKAFEMYWHAEGMKTLFDGYVILDGEKYIVTKENSYGYADKNWGKDFTSPWVWLSSNHLVSNLTQKQLTNSVFDIGGGRPKVFGIPLNRKLLGAFWYEGTDYEFNFSKFWTCPKIEFSSTETEDEVIWNVTLENRTAVMKTEVHCKKDEMLWINYEAPNGLKRHNRLWNGGTGTGRIQLYRKEHGKLELIDDITAYHIGCEYGEYDKNLDK